DCEHKQSLRVEDRGSTMQYGPWLRFKGSNSKPWSKNSGEQRIQYQHGDEGNKHANRKTYTNEDGPEPTSNCLSDSSPENQRNQTPTGEEDGQLGRLNPNLVTQEATMVILEESARKRDQRRRDQRQREEHNSVAQEVFMAIPEEFVRMLDQWQREGHNSVVQEITMVIPEESVRKLEQRRSEGPRSEFITLPNWGKHQYDKDVEGMDRASTIINGLNFLNEEGDQNSKRRVGLWKKKARVINGVPMQVEDVVGTKRTAEVAIVAVDPEDSSGEPKKKPRCMEILRCTELEMVGKRSNVSTDKQQKSRCERSLVFYCDQRSTTTEQLGSVGSISPKLWSLVAMDMLLELLARVVHLQIQLSTLVHVEVFWLTIMLEWPCSHLQSGPRYAKDDDDATGGAPSRSYLLFVATAMDATGLGLV
ncbi:hypothetical protein U1Q18_011607, partial [Sarracenia purpurea var. burkii]